MKSSSGAAASNLTAPSKVSPGCTPLRSDAALSSTEKKTGMHSLAASRVKPGAFPVHNKFALFQTPGVALSNNGPLTSLTTACDRTGSIVVGSERERFREISVRRDDLA